MPLKKILILESDLLLNAGVKNLLAGREDLSIHGAICGDLKELNAVIDQFQPDIIISAENNASVNSNEITNFLKVLPKVKTILINLEDNQVEIFDKRELSVKQLSDFLSALNIS